MSGFIFFIIGTMLGGLAGVVIMCCLQINRLAEREEVKNAKTKYPDTFPLDRGRSRIKCQDRMYKKYDIKMYIYSLGCI